MIYFRVFFFFFFQAEDGIRDKLVTGVQTCALPIFTLSTDDPPFFGTDLLREWERAQQELDLSVAELWELNLNGLRYGLADTALRRKLLREFETAGRGFGL